MVLGVVWLVTAAVGALVLGAAIRLRETRTTPMIPGSGDATSRPAPRRTVLSGAAGA